MASILNEYINKRLGLIDLQNELIKLIGKYNSHTGRYMFIYAADINKGKRGVDVSLAQEDFFNIQDILRESEQKKIDFYIETPGGSGEAAEEIAKFLRKKFEEVNFVIAGEAKSAGTILVLSGDNIYMTETGSLGPIDAQIKMGRSVISAYDYKEWVDLKRNEAEMTGKLNPVDAMMIAQISPGELYGVINSLEFAKDLVKEWLEQYKFKNWTITKNTRRTVTQEMKKNRADEIANMLCNHSAWRTHGRSLKIEDLSEHLIIENIDNDKILSDIVYRIKTIIRLIFDSSTVYKLFYDNDLQISKTFSIAPQQSAHPFPPSSLMPLKPNKTTIDTIGLDIQCPQCGKRHQIVGYLDTSTATIVTKKLPTNPNIKDNDILICDNCNFALDLKPIKNQVESQAKRKVSFK